MNIERFATSLTLLLCTITSALAYHFESGGLYYEIGWGENECWLTRNPEDPYSGKIDIPSTVQHDGMTYYVKAIVGAAFYNCEHLTAVTIPNTVTSINEQSFYSCSALKNVKLPDNIEYLGGQSFERCTSLEEITLPGSLGERMGSYMFHDCTSLKRAIVGEGITQLPSNTFDGCTALESVSLPSTLRAIDDNVFCDNTNLKSIQLPDGLVGLGMIWGCTSLSELKLPTGLKTFGGVSGSAVAEINLPAGITEIRSMAFMGCKKLKKVTAKSPVIYIGPSAFSDCELLETLPPLLEVTSVGRYAFDGCKSIKSLIFSDKLLHIGVEDGMEPDGFAARCTALEEVVLGDNVKHIPSQSFVSSGIRSFKVPARCESIGANAFWGCRQLESIEMPKHMKSLGARNDSGLVGTVFRDCTSLRSIVIPEGIETIESSTFTGCTSLESVQLPSTLKHLGEWAFRNCPLTELRLPEGLLTIGSQAIELPMLRELTIPGSVISADLNWMECENLERLIFADGKKPMSSNQICGSPRKKLSYLHIGRNITNPESDICISGFMFGALTSVSIGEYVTDLSCVQFHMLDNLQSIICKPMNPPVVKEFSENQYLAISPQIDSNAIEAYESDMVWKKFRSFSPSDGLNDVNEVMLDPTDSDIHIFDMNGRHIGSSTAGLPNGLYIIRNGNKTSKLLVK